MKEKDEDKEKYLTYHEIQEQLKQCQDFILSLRDVSVLDRGSEIVHYIKTYDLEKPPHASHLRDALKHFEIDSNPIIDDDYSLELDFKVNEDCTKFISATNDGKLVNFKKLSIRNSNYLLKQDITDLNRFFDRSTPNLLQIFYFHGGENSPLSAHMESLPSILRNVQSQIYLDWWSLSSSDLQSVLEHSFKVKKLVLNYCKVGQISRTFSIDQKLAYKIEALDLYGTFNPFDSEYMSFYGFKSLVRAMGSTQLKQSLKKVHIFKEAMGKEDAQKIFDYYQFGLKVRSDRKWANSE